MSEPLITRLIASESLPQWQLQEAKNRFSAVVKAAGSSAQMVTVHGVPAAVVVSPQDYERLLAGQSATLRLSQDLLCPLLEDADADVFDRDRRHNPSREPAL